MAITLGAGDAPPEFELPDQDGNLHRLSEYRGQTVVLYFYPRDETPGCTTQACSLRDTHDEILTEDAVVLGVSTDDAESHRSFREITDCHFRYWSTRMRPSPRNTVLGEKKCSMAADS